MITPSFNLTATERVLPKLALDFTTASLDSRVTFTRTGGTATRVNASGYIEVVGADTPRFDYDPVTLACKGLLIEESRTNLILQSRNLNTSWSKTRCNAVDAGGSTAPDNAASTRITCDTTSASGYYTLQNVTRSASTTYTFSVTLKKGNNDYAAVTLYDGGANYYRQYFNISTGAVLGTASSGWTGSGSVQNLGNGWYRCSVTAATTTGTSLQIIVYPSQPSEGNFNCTSGDYSDVYGAQCEAGAFATSYIPTTTAQVTRTADVATMTGTNFSDWFNASEGTFAFNCSSAALASIYMPLTISDGTNNERMRFLYQAGSQFIIVDGGTSQASLDGGSAIAGDYTHFCGAYKADDFGLALDGGSTVTDSSGILPTVDRIGIGNFEGSYQISGIFKNLSYFPQRLTDSEIQAFSKG